MHVVKTYDLEEIACILEGRNYFFQTGASCSPLPNASVLETPFATLYSSGLDYPLSNGVLPKTEKSPTDEEINDILLFFQKKRLPFVWWTEDKKLTHFGFTYGGKSLGLVCDLQQPLPPLKKSDSLSFVETSSPEELLQFSKAHLTSFSQDPNSLSFAVEHDKKTFEQGHRRHFLAKIGEATAGTVTLSLGATTCSIWNLTTLPAFRQRGVASYLIQEAIKEGKEAGYQRAVTLLLPQAKALKAFSQQGFSPICSLSYYIHGADKDSVEPT